MYTYTGAAASVASRRNIVIAISVSRAGATTEGAQGQGQRQGPYYRTLAHVARGSRGLQERGQSLACMQGRDDEQTPAICFQLIPHVAAYRSLFHNWEILVRYTTVCKGPPIGGCHALRGRGRGGLSLPHSSTLFLSLCLPLARPRSLYLPLSLIHSLSLSLSCVCVCCNVD